MNTAIATGFTAVVLLAVLAWDHFKGPLPYVRAGRGYIAAAIGLLLTILTLGLLRKRRPDGEPDVPPQPRVFDDATTIENHKAAADTDVDAAGDAAATPSLDDLQSELDKL